MTQASGPRIALVACAVALALGAVSAEGAPDAPPSRAPVHADSAALEMAILDATRAFLREDLVAARAALDRVESSCRRLDRERDGAISIDVVLFDQAFHKTLDVAREYSGRGLGERAFDQLRWIQKSCRTCHEIARKEGIPGVPVPTTPSGAPSGASAP